VDLKPILAGAGVAGLAIGFGAQTLVKDLIAGFFLLLENQVRVNDVVTIGDATGLVEAMNLRTTVLRDVDGRVHIVPNGAISIVTNHTREWSRALLDVGVAYKENTDDCFAILREVGAGLERDPVYGPKLMGPFEYPGIERFAESAVVLRMMVRTRPLEQWAVLRESRRRVKQAFAEHGIELPYPHLTLMIGDGPGGARVVVERDTPA
jgi:small conductance mechanosensitive channel